MSANTDPGRAHDATSLAYAEVLLHIGSHGYRAVVEWLEALIAQQQAAMTSCARDKLGDAQVRLRQLIAMRGALASPDSAGTGHVFD